MSASGTATITGLVQPANERGLLLSGEETWRNVSKFAADCPRPQTFDGNHVSLLLDAQGYVREISPADAAPPPAPPVVRAEPVTSKVQATTEPLSRDVIIARQVALKAAVELLSADISTQPDPEITTSLATTFEQWLMRPAS